MTAGSGIIHQEMPKPSKETMHGLQLWVNLPAKHKMLEPRYRGILKNDVHVIETPDAEVRVIAGSFLNVNGPVCDLMNTDEELERAFRELDDVTFIRTRPHI